MTKQEAEKTTRTVLDDFVEAGEALVNSIELGVLKLWNVEQDRSSGKIVVFKNDAARKATSVCLKVDSKGSHVEVEFQGMNFGYEPCKLAPTKVNGYRVGLFFSKEDAKLALRKELKARLEEDLAERMKAVNVLKASIEELDSEIAKAKDA